jgi:RNA polymerase sigma-70 factor (ECF subfamily)
MVEGSDFRNLIAQVRAGNEAAAAQLVRLYEPAIRRAARIRLANTRLRRLLDSMDISQSVFASFFVRAALGQYELNEPQQVLRLLVSMSRKKLADHARQQTAARRDNRRLRGAAPREAELATADTSPSGQVAAQELLEEFRKRLSGQEQQLAQLRAEGRDWAQIAQEQGQSAEALRKRLTRAIDRVAHELGLDDLEHD